jgi:hypothetical protein
MRDDSASTSGIRYLLGFRATGSVTPFGVYLANLPQTLDFKTHSYITYYIVNRSPVISGRDTGTKLREVLLAVTAWSESDTTKERILRRVERVLDGMAKVARAGSQSDIHGIHYESSGPDLFDDSEKVYYRTDQYRVWYRDDITR